MSENWRIQFSAMSAPAVSIVAWLSYDSVVVSGPPSAWFLVSRPRQSGDAAWAAASAAEVTITEP